jgi:hypothetical protein
MAKRDRRLKFTTAEYGATLAADEYIMRIAILMPLVAAVLLPGLPAQSSQPVHPQIRGLVLEPETNQPVVGAAIEVYGRESGTSFINGGWKSGASAKAVTDATGAFTVSVSELGSYRIQAKMAGYGPLVSGSLDSAAFSPDGARTVTASGQFFGTDKTARIWDAATGKELTVLRGHESYV